MEEMFQKIRTILIPEKGLDLEPPYVMEAEVSSKFNRALSHMVGKAEDGGVLIRATSDGRLYVVTAGVTFEWYDVETDNAPDDWDELQTYEYEDAVLRTDIFIKTFDAEFQWKNQAGEWGAVKQAPKGAMSFDFTNYGIRIRNETPLSVAVFEFTLYR